MCKGMCSSQAWTTYSPTCSLIVPPQLEKDMMMAAPTASPHQESEYEQQLCSCSSLPPPRRWEAPGGLLAQWLPKRNKPCLHPHLFLLRGGENVATHPLNHQQKGAGAAWMWHPPLKKGNKGSHCPHHCHHDYH